MGLDGSEADRPPLSETYDAVHRSDVSKAVPSGHRDRGRHLGLWLRDLGGEPSLRSGRPLAGLAPEVEAALPSG